MQVIPKINKLHLNLDLILFVNFLSIYIVLCEIFFFVLIFTNITKHTMNKMFHVLVKMCLPHICMKSSVVSVLSFPCFAHRPQSEIIGLLFHVLFAGTRKPI